MAITEEVITKYIADVSDYNAKFTEMENRLKAVEGKAASTGQTTKKAFQETGKEADSLNNKLSGQLSSTLTKIGAAVLAAFSVHQIIAFGKATVDAFIKAELSAKKLQTAVGAGGGLQKDFEVLIQQSKELQKTTIFNDETIQDAQTMALQFGLNAQAVKDLIPLIIDFASATGQDLGSALSTVLRGTTGQTRGLKVYGIEVDSSATRTQKFTSIVQQLTDKFQGQGKVVGETVGGRLKQLSNAWDELKESIGGALAPLVSGAAELAKSFLSIAETPLSEKLQEEQLQLELTSIKLSSLNEGSKERSDIIKKLQSQYPEYLGNINAEKISNEDLQKALRKVNDQLILKIALAKGDEEIVEVQEKVADALLKTSKQEDILIRQIRQRLEQAQKTNPVLAQELKTKLQGLSLDEQAILIQQSGLDVSGKILESVSNRAKADSELKKAQDELTKSQQKRIEEEQRLRGILNIPATEEKLSGGGDFLKKTDEEIKAEQEAARKKLDERQKLDKETRDAQEELAKFTFGELSKSIDLQVSLEKEAALNRIGNAEDAQQEFLRIEQRGLEQRLQAAKDTLQDTSDIEKQLVDNRIKQIEAGNKAALNIRPNQKDYEEWLKISKEAAEEDVKNKKEAEEKKREQIQQTFDLAQELTNSLQELLQSETDQELEQVEARRDARIEGIDQQIAALEDANDKGRLSDKKFEEQKAALLKQREAAEKKALEEQNKIKRQEAEREKLLALFRIGLILAEAIAEVNVFKIIAATAELSVVAATPIPTFARGTKGKDKPGIGLVGEQGAEFIYMPSKSKVVPAPQTKKYEGMLDAMIDNRLEQYVFKNYVAPALLEANKKAEQKQSQSFAENIARSFKLQGGMDEYGMMRALGSGTVIKNPDALGKAIAKHINTGYKNPRYR